MRVKLMTDPPQFLVVGGHLAQGGNAILPDVEYGVEECKTLLQRSSW